MADEANESPKSLLETVTTTKPKGKKSDKVYIGMKLSLAHVSELAKQLGIEADNGAAIARKAINKATGFEFQVAPREEGDESDTLFVGVGVSTADFRTICGNLGVNPDEVGGTPVFREVVKAVYGAR